MIIAALLALSGPAQQTPEVPAELIGAAAVVCMKVRPGGHGADAFMITGTGNAVKNAALLAWVRKLEWMNVDGSAPDVSKDWLPEPIAFGDVVPPKPPARCAPPARG